MGRKRSINTKLPPNMHQKGGSFYYVRLVNGKRKWFPLGNDAAVARIKWAELANKIDAASNFVTFLHAATRYRMEILPNKAPKTQKEYDRQLDRLVAVFGRVPLEQITPQFVRQYLDSREAKIAANREKALLSTVFNHAREWGYTTAANPCTGVKGHRETGRLRYKDAVIRNGQVTAALGHVAAVWRPSQHSGDRRMVSMKNALSNMAFGYDNGCQQYH